MSTRLISAAELLDAPTGIDWSTVSEATDADSVEEAVEQSNLIASASAWVHNTCGMAVGLHATQQTEGYVLRRAAHFGAKAIVTREGSLAFRTDTLPIISVVSLQYAPLPPPYAFTALDPTKVVLTGDYPQVISIEDWQIDWSALAYGGISQYGQGWTTQTLVQLVYQSGWPNMFTTGTLTAGSNVAIAVDSSIGAQLAPLTTGQDNSTLTVWDGDNEETVTVTAVPDTTHITVASLAYNHAKGVRISNMPTDIRLATIYACMDMVRTRGVDALVMDSARSVTQEGPMTKGDVLDEAEILLQPYCRRI